jgi:acylphosphatase
MKKQLHIKVTGRVQGVCFRMYTCMEAARLGVAGWVRNCDDGSVELVAEGDPDAVDALAAWCHHGPPSARVNAVAVTEGPARSGYNGFDVRD